MSAAPTTAETETHRPTKDVDPMTAAELTMITTPTGPARSAAHAPASTGRVRAALRTLGWWIVDGLATDNGWVGGVSVGWVPSMAYAARIVARPDLDHRLAQRGLRRH